ncbi:flagellar assembly protein FliH [Desulfoscipio geothermicus DSM 3669]|uniref:Flagellar assembly protein FliH n=2 Tax=Desulfoscipio geothermicus TaxID=39060 RepID=A0A1I6CV10_9FIRM|nr:flagellar assembly protein FliH [Desulfoscipio geothermicus DSM 3669]
MPLLHKIIRNRQSGISELQVRYNLDLRHHFIVGNNAGDMAQQKQAVESIPSDLLAEARNEAKAIINRAQQAASTIIEKARQAATAEAEKINTEAAREGYAEGYRAAMEEARNEAKKIRAEARTVLARAEEARREKLASLKTEIRNLALEIAEKLVNRELELDPDAVLAIVKESIQLVSNRKYVVLWVHPAEKEMCEKHRERLLGHLPPRAELQIMTDEAVGRGGCVVETDYGKVDARLSTRWQALLKSFNNEGAG